MFGRRLLPLVALTVALSAHAAGRPPGPLDTDGDGLPDDWETNGVTLDGGAGPQWIDLPAMGADPTRPDVFLQIDWMAGAEHDQHPSAEALKLVVDAFANAPYTSPTGSAGIVLHVDAGPDSRLADSTTWGALSRARALPWQKNLGTAATGTYDWTAFEAIRKAPGGFVDTGRAPVFHYAVFAHFHDLDDPHGWGASGNSRGIGGTDLLVTLGNFSGGVGTAREQAGTLMHELGHNLGLRHGGCDDTNLKPGYASVMNYAYQMEGVSRGGMRGVIDFSRGATPVLDDVLLDEPPTLLAGGPLEADGKSRSCVAPGEVRAGIAVRPAPPPAASTPAADGCGDGAAVDDWKSIRLDLGGIGKPRAPRR
jgi:hypothetical protein